MPKLRDEVESQQVYTRGFIAGCEVRALDEEKRTAEFVAATEAGVDTWGGKEYLRMSGAKLTRYRSNPVVLDTHDRYSAASVIGRAAVKVEGKALVASVTFAETARAEEVWQLVKGGFLRALSVGFMPYAGTIKRLAEGEIDGEGEDAITGPARIIRSWELYEISVVPVPADAGALRRALGEGHVEAIAELLSALGIEPRQSGEKRGVQMDEKKQDTAPETKGAETKTETPAAEVRTLPAEVERAASIRANAPKGMERLADELVARGLTLEDARKRFLEELAKVTPPVGTSEPETKTEAKRTIDTISDRDLADSILG